MRLNVGECSTSPSLITPRITLAVSLQPSTGKALLLTNSTEVSIAPKVRAKTKQSKGSVNSKGTKTTGAMNGSSAEDTPALEKAKASKHAKTLRLLPQRFLRDLPSATASTSGETLAFVSFRTLLSVYPQASSTQQLRGWRAVVRRLAPPVSPGKDEASTSPLAQATPRVLVPNGESSSKPAAGTTPAKDEVLVMWSPDIPVPDGHVALQQPCEGAEDWDLVRYALGFLLVLRPDLRAHRLVFEKEDSSASIPSYQASHASGTSS